MSMLPFGKDYPASDPQLKKQAGEAYKKIIDAGPQPDRIQFTPPDYYKNWNQARDKRVTDRLFDTLGKKKSWGSTFAMNMFPFGQRLYQRMVRNQDTIQSKADAAQERLDNTGPDGPNFKAWEQEGGPPPGLQAELDTLEEDALDYSLNYKPEEHLYLLEDIPLSYHYPIFQAHDLDHAKKIRNTLMRELEIERINQEQFMFGNVAPLTAILAGNLLDLDIFIGGAGALAKAPKSLNFIGRNLNRAGTGFLLGGVVGTGVGIAENQLSEYVTPDMILEYGAYSALFGAGLMAGLPVAGKTLATLGKGYFKYGPKWFKPGHPEIAPVPPRQGPFGEIPGVPRIPAKRRKFRPWHATASIGGLTGIGFSAEAIASNIIQSLDTPEGTPTSQDQGPPKGTSPLGADIKTEVLPIETSSLNLGDLMALQSLQGIVPSLSDIFSVLATPAEAPGASEIEEIPDIQDIITPVKELETPPKTPKSDTEFPSVEELPDLESPFDTTEGQSSLKSPGTRWDFISGALAELKELKSQEGPDVGEVPEGWSALAGPADIVLPELTSPHPSVYSGESPDASGDPVPKGDFFGIGQDWPDRTLMSILSNRMLYMNTEPKDVIQVLTDHSLYQNLPDNKSYLYPSEDINNQIRDLYQTIFNSAEVRDNTLDTRTDIILNGIMKIVYNKRRILTNLLDKTNNRSYNYHTFDDRARAEAQLSYLNNYEKRLNKEFSTTFNDAFDFKF